MSNNIAVRTEQLHATAAQIKGGAGTIESTLQQLTGYVAPLQGEWRGSAQTQFQTLWAEWQRSATGLQHALQGISQLMANAAVHYADTEETITSSFTGV